MCIRDRYNDISDTGYTQSDGALSQMMVGQQPGAEIRYNWLHDTIKYGARFDGNGLGNNGLMHHNVLWNTGKALMVKGFNHSVYHNTAFDSSNGNDILIMIAQGGNEGTQTINNAANRIAGHRSGTYSAYPVPGTYSNNWNGYVTGGDVKDELIDPLGTLTGTRDFRPKAGSALIDAGSVVPGVTGSYLGSAPDIGAYEAGAAHWVPGVTWDVSAKNGTFVPPGAEAEASSGGSASGGGASGSSACCASTAAGGCASRCCGSAFGVAACLSSSSSIAARVLGELAHSGAEATRMHIFLFRFACFVKSHF